MYFVAELSDMCL